jgi:hypothetical protein
MKYLVLNKGKRIGIFYAESKWDAITQAYAFLEFKTERKHIDAINLKYLNKRKSCKK